MVGPPLLRSVNEGNTIRDSRLGIGRRAAARRTAMRRMGIILAASAALVGGAAQAQIERGPAALAGTAKNFTPIEKAACGPNWGRWCGPWRHRVCGRYHCWCAP